VSAGLTTDLAALSSAVTLDDLPGDVVEVARHALLDWFGVTLGAGDEPAALILLDTLPPDDGGAATIVGKSVRYAPVQAALINGTASHALDFDDVDTTFLGHASVAILPAALALAEQIDATVGDLIAAYVAGYETVCRIAVAIGPQPYMSGFHQTGTVGTFGAAAATANLLRLDRAKTATAYAIAATQAAGLRCNFGTMAKPLHAGKACENGLLATLLAARGFTANPTAIEADQGFAALSGGTCDRDAALAEPPSGWYVRDNLFKYHASCFWTHSMLEGVGELVAAGSFAAADVERVDLHVSDLELGAAAIPSPATALEVKFSLAHLAAMALHGRTTSVIADSDATDAELIATRAKVNLVGDGTAGTPTRVEVTHAGGVDEAARVVITPERDRSVRAARLW
jgi:2-methylcitrate dehydratase PrpD